MMRTKSRELLPVGIAAALLTLASGCAGNLECNLINTHMGDIMVRPTDARIVRMNCTECYHWVDPGKHLNITGKGVTKSLLGSQFDREFYISFVLDEPSNGVGKNYSLNYNSVRGYIRSGSNVYRFTGTYGILGSENCANGEIVGAYRTFVNLSGAQIFGGWSRPIPFVIFGELTAKPDQDGRGKAIREKTEQDGYSRKAARTGKSNQAIKEMRR